MTAYVRNVWYVAAWEEEIKGVDWLSRRLLGEPHLIYRTLDGNGYVMMEDRCPHRFAPLRLGQRRNDAVVCKYHGLAFGPDGACVHAPFGSPPAHVRVKCTPVVARHGLLWFWPGDPTLADQSTIPDFSFLDEQHAWRRSSTFGGNYELVVDNLMDLSHADFLHDNTFAPQGGHSRAEQDVFDGENSTIWSHWKIENAVKMPFFSAVFEGIDKIDQFLEMRWSAPASMVLKIVWTEHGQSKDQAKVSVINPHIITPETEHSSHYFWTCDPTPESEAFARAIFDTEDGPMIEAVQSNMDDGDFWKLKPAILKQDLAAIRARRRLIKLRHEEKQKVDAGTAGRVDDTRDSLVSVLPK